MNTRHTLLRFVFLLLSLPLSVTGQPVMAANRAVIAANPEATALVAAWTLPSLIDEQSSQAVTGCVQAAFEVSKWSRTLTGTLTWSSTGATYRPTPNDRMRVNYANGRVIDFVITDIQGYPNQGPDEFLDRDYQINCRGTEKDHADLMVVARQVGGVILTITVGAVIFHGVQYQVDTQTMRNIYSESDSSGASYRRETALQGNVTGPSFKLTINENFFYELVSSNRLTATSSRRTTNNQWHVAGRGYALDSIFRRSDTDGHPANVDIEWHATGVIQRDNQPWGTVISQLNGDSFEIWAVLPKGKIEMEAISLL